MSDKLSLLDVKNRSWSLAINCERTWEKFYDNNICKLHVSTGDDQDKTDRFLNNLLSTNDEQHISM